MVNYPDLSSLGDNATINDFMAFPNSVNQSFWTLILVGLFAIFTFSLYFREKSLRGVGNLLSSAAVSSLVIIVLTTIGTLMNIITLTASLPIYIFCVVVIAIWLFSQ